MLSFLTKFNTHIAIDLGTANTLISIAQKGIVLDEPSVVAYRTGSGKRSIIAVGKEARNILGRTPANVFTVRPLRDGVIADFEAAEEMIRAFLRKANPHSTFRRTTVVICVPSGATSVEHRIIRESVLRVGAKSVHLLAEPMAAALGAELPVSKAHGSMIIDIGGGTTEIAVVSYGGIVHAKSIRTAGDKMDEAIQNYVRRTHGMLIGDSTAERIKKEIGCAKIPEDHEAAVAGTKFNADHDFSTEMIQASSEKRTTTIRGQDSASGNPRRIEFSEDQIAEALQDCLHEIFESVQTVLELTPPELSADIIDKGIVIAGGGALLRNIGIALQARLGIMVSIANDPLTCVARGTAKTLENIDRYSRYFCEVP